MVLNVYTYENIFMRSLWSMRGHHPIRKGA